MRIISGKYKGKKINPPGNLHLRPTTDFAKEGLFNYLNNRINFEGISVLDLFCGTGNITYEFASRGAEHITCVEANYKCSEFIKKTIQSLSDSNIKVINTDVFKFITSDNNTYDLIFADPPYDLQQTQILPELLFERKLLNKEGIFILEHPKEKNFSDHPFFEEMRSYGKVLFSFFICK